MMNATIPAAPVSVLAARAVLARPSISTWSARKFDKGASERITTASGAKRDAARVNKLLVAGETLADLQRIDREARTYHYVMTLPWCDDGARILPATLYLEYTARMSALRTEFESAVESFLLAYPEYVAGARQRLGDLFRREDYPAASHLRRRFSFDLGIMPIPSGNDFRLDVPDSVRADVEKRVADALTLAMGDARDRIADVVGRMVDRLRTYKPATGDAKAEGVFRDSLISNVRDLCDLLPAFNLTNDPKFDSFVARMRADLCKHDADALRDDAAMRAEVAAKAESILADMGDFIA